MLKKLLKYDFVWIERVIAWYTLAACAIGCFRLATDRIYNEGNSAVFWLIMDKIAVSLLIVGCITLFLIAFLRTMARFVRTLYKDQSYFTHTLPVDRKTVFGAKALCGAAVMTLALLGIALSVLIGGGRAMWDMIKETLKTHPGAFVLMGVTLVLEGITLLFAAYLGHVLGYRRNKGKAAYSVLFSLLIYYAVQNMLLISLLILSLVDPDIGAVFRNNAMEFTPETMGATVTKVLAVASAGYAAAAVGLFFLGRAAFEKGVNVD